MNRNEGVLKVGDKVMSDGFPGTVVKVCDGQLVGMVEIRLESGVRCDSTADYFSGYANTYKIEKESE